MTTITNLSKQGQASSGVSFDGTDKFTFDVSEINAVITAYNAATASNYPTWDTVTDNYEKLVHFILVFSKIQNLVLGNDTFNIKWTGTTPQNQLFGTRGSLNSRILSFAFPFSSQSDVDGDSDNLG
jgi:hypothetical protein